jgi:hypothetical protein
VQCFGSKVWCEGWACERGISVVEKCVLCQKSGTGGSNKVNFSFLLDQWFEGEFLCDKFQKPYELDDKRLVSVEEMSRFRWDVEGTGWRWCRRFHA